MSSTTQKYVLIGPHKGKTLLVNGHPFVDGEYVYQGSVNDCANLAKLFGFYGAVTAAEAELIEANEKIAALTKQAHGTSGNGMVEKTGQPSLVGGDLPPPQPPAAPPKPTLAEAISHHSWEQETHWTSNNLPSLEFLAEITGKKPTRADVEAIAEGYTRAKAKSLATG
jgi:hypothetical protein